MELPIFLGVSVEIQVKVKLRNEETQNTKLTKKTSTKNEDWQFMDQSRFVGFDGGLHVN